MVSKITGFREMVLLSPRILRQRTIIRHITPTDREITEEITLLNDHKETLPYILLKYLNYRPAMEICDETGAAVGILTNEAVRELLSQSNDPDAKSLLDEINSRKKYIQWMSLPEEKSFKPFQIRVLQFKYREPIVKKKYERDSFEKRFFDIPQFDVAKDVEETEQYSNIITVIPPDGFRVRLEKRLARVSQDGKFRELTDNDHYHMTVADNILDVNIPHVPHGKVLFRLLYGIYLSPTEQKILSRFILGLIALSIISAIFELGFLGSLTLTIPALHIGSYHLARDTIPISSNFTGHSDELDTVIVFTGLVFIGFTTNPLTHRTKYWALLAIVITVFSVLLSGTFG